MKLSNVSIKKLIKGACYFEEKEGYLCSYHYTKEHLDYFSQFEFWDARSRVSAGIRLELITDATQIGFKLKAFSDSSQSTVDLYVDGFAHSIYYIANRGEYKVAFEMPQGKKRVSIYFPVDSEIGIKALTFNGSYKSVKDRRTKTLVIGDSITQGYGGVYAGASYINILARENGLEILNQAIGGYRFDEGGVRKIDGFDPDRIIVALGTNYYDCPEIYDYEAATKSFFKKLNELFGEKKTVVLTPVWRGDNTKWDRLNWCIQVIRDACANYENITVIDGFKLIPPLGEYYMTDKVHPNPLGMSTMAKNLEKELKKIKF